MNLASHLVARGDEVLGISRSPMRSKPFTYGLEDSKQFKYSQAHLVTQLPQAMTMLDVFRPDVIVNFAALCEVGLSWAYPLDYYETNLMALVRLTNELANRTWLGRFIQIGSSEVYGSVERPADEDHPVKPSSPYAASKAAFDFHLRAISSHQGFPGVNVMPSNGYCEGQTLNRIIPKTIIAALTGKKFTLLGGKAEKSYLHADDISRAILLVAENGKLGGLYNCGAEEPISIYDLVHTVAAMMGKELTEVCDLSAPRLGEDSRYWLDSTKIKALGWKPEIALTTGLRRMIAWIKKYPELLTADQSYLHRP